MQLYWGITINNKQLTSKLKVSGAVSDIVVKALFNKRVIEMSVKLNVPLNRTVKGQLGWLKRQLGKCNKIHKELYSCICSELKVDINIKYVKGVDRISLDKIDDFYSKIKKREISEFGVVMIKDFGKQFSSTQKFVKIIEQMLLNFYECIVEHLVKWEKPVPQISENIKIMKE